MANSPKQAQTSSLDNLIQEALQKEVQTKQDQRRLKRRKQQRQSEEELQNSEDDEIAPALENQPQEAAVKEEEQFALQKQQQKRQKYVDGQDDQDGDDGVYEEEGQVYEDEVGVRVEPFNLKEERTRGYFDAAGNYVENKGGKDDEDDEGVTDAWLDSTQVMSKQQIEKVKKLRKQQEDKVDILDSISSQKVYSQIAQILQEEETVPNALRRLKKENNQNQLLKLTELADALMRIGETDVYTFTKRQFEAESKIALDDDGDMFADDDNENDNNFYLQQQNNSNNNQNNINQINYPHIAVLQEWFRQQQQVDYSQWPVKELNRLLEERGIKFENIVEKDELIKKVQQVVQSNGMNAPPGFVFDPTSSYFWNGEAQMYFEPVTKYFCLGQTGDWYAFDYQNGQFSKVEA